MSLCHFSQASATRLVAVQWHSTIVGSVMFAVVYKTALLVPRHSPSLLSNSCSMKISLVLKFMFTNHQGLVCLFKLP